MGKILTMAHHFFSGLWEIIVAIYEGDMKLPMEEMQEEINIPVVNTGPTPQEKLLSYARKYVGTDASPEDDVDDAVACAISASNVIKCLYSDFPDITGTWTLNEYLKADKRFKGTLELSPGNIWIFPTGTGNGVIRGHVFIVGENGEFYSNSSFTGIWGNYYTKDEIIERYVVRGKLKQYIYEPVENSPT